MKRFTLTDGFSLLAAAGRLLLLFPLLNLAGALGGAFSLLAALCGQGVLWALAGCGYLLVRLLEGRRLPTGPLRLLAVALTAVGGFLLCPWEGLVSRLLVGGLCCAALVLGSTFYGSSYSGIFQQGWYLKILLILHLAVAGALWWLSGRGWAEYDLGYLTVSMVVSLGIYALCGNQVNIDYHMQRRRHRMELLPGKIRVYNLRLMSVVLGVILLLFLLRDWVVRGLWLFLQGAVWLVAGIVWLFFKLLSLLPVFARWEGEPSSSGEAPALLGRGDGIWDLWLYLILAVVALIVLWRSRRAVLRGLRWIWRQLAALVHWLMSFARPERAQEQQDATLYYTDEVRSLRPEETAAQTQARRFRARDWRKEYSRFLRMPAGDAARYRAGYRLVLQYLAANACYASGDTVHELGVRAADLPGLEAYAPAADGYDHVRYGEAAPSAQEEARLQDLLQQIAARLGRR